MLMHVDHARHQRAPAAVDHGGAVGAEVLTNLLDQVALDEHIGVDQLVIAAVEHLDVGEYRDGGLFRVCRLGRRQRGRTHGYYKCNKNTSSQFLHVKSSSEYVIVVQFRYAFLMATGAVRIWPLTASALLMPSVGCAAICSTTSIPSTTLPKAGKPRVSGSVRPSTSNTGESPVQMKNSGIPSPLARILRARDTVPLPCVMPESSVVSNSGSVFTGEPFRSSENSPVAASNRKPPWMIREDLALAETEPPAR